MPGGVGQRLQERDQHLTLAETTPPPRPWAARPSRPPRPTTDRRSTRPPPCTPRRRTTLRRPAPDSTTTSTPSPRRPIVSGTSATRRSPVVDSLGMPRRIARSYRIARGSQREKRSSVAPSTLARVTSLLLQYGLVLLFAMVAIESAGVPIPGETALITAAFFARPEYHHWSLISVIVVAAAAAIIGDNIGYCARPVRRPRADRPLGLREALRGQGAAALGAVLSEARRQDGVLRALHRDPARDRRVARRAEPHALVALLHVERRRRHLWATGVSVLAYWPARRSPRRSRSTASTASWRSSRSVSSGSSRSGTGATGSSRAREPAAQGLRRGR